jgi:hypothetical protein
MPADLETINAYKAQYAEDLGDFIDAKKKADSEIVDFLVTPYDGRTHEINRFNEKYDSDELFKLAKVIEQMAEAKQALERTKHHAKMNGVAL